MWKVQGMSLQEMYFVKTPNRQVHTLLLLLISVSPPCADRDVLGEKCRAGCCCPFSDAAAAAIRDTTQVS